MIGSRLTSSSLVKENVTNILVEVYDDYLFKKQYIMKNLSFTAQEGWYNQVVRFFFLNDLTESSLSENPFFDSHCSFVFSVCVIDKNKDISEIQVYAHLNMNCTWQLTALGKISAVWSLAIVSDSKWSLWPAVTQTHLAARKCGVLYH